MTKPPITLQDLRRRLYVKAKAEPSWRFWGLYGHVCKRETLRAAYELAKQNDGAPGRDGVTFDAIEADGVDAFLDQLREELGQRCYRPQRPRKVGIPKEGGKVRQLSIPSVRDRVVQGALKLILEPIFEADFQSGSYGYRPKQSAHAAVQRVSEAIIQGKTYIIDLDLKSYFDTVRHHIVLAKVASRVRDDAVLWLLRVMLKASGRQGVPQGGVISPLLSNVYLTEVDRMLERAKAVTRHQQWTYVEYGVSLMTWWCLWMRIRGSGGCAWRWSSDCGRSWRNCKSRSTRRRVGVWTSRKARASDFWASSSVGFAVGEADGCRG
jgi:RNA-directed DNA polymerase